MSTNRMYLGRSFDASWVADKVETTRARHADGREEHVVCVYFSQHGNEHNNRWFFLYADGRLVEVEGAGDFDDDERGSSETVVELCSSGIHVELYAWEVDERTAERARAEARRLLREEVGG